jgi:hypothetical protein
MASTKDVAEVIMIDIEYTESFAWKLGTYIKLIDLGEAMTQGKIIELGISDTQNETHLVWTLEEIVFSHYYGVLTPLNQWWKNL